MLLMISYFLFFGRTIDGRRLSMNMNGNNPKWLDTSLHTSLHSLDGRFIHIEPLINQKKDENPFKPEKVHFWRAVKWTVKNLFFLSQNAFVCAPRARGKNAKLGNFTMLRVMAHILWHWKEIQRKFLNTPVKITKLKIEISPENQWTWDHDARESPQWMNESLLAFLCEKRREVLREFREFPG